jgi:hypothetical protein
MKIKERKISELRPAEYNSRHLTRKQYKALRRSMEELGDLGVAVINMYPGRENVIIAGHQRIRIARAMKRETFPCLEVKFDPAMERKANLRLNRGGEWDYDTLANEFDLDELLAEGFTAAELRLDEDEDPDDGGDGAGGDGEPEEKPRHVLITFPAGKLLDVQDHLDKLEDLDGIAIDWKPALRAPKRHARKSA